MKRTSLIIEQNRKKLQPKKLVSFYIDIDRQNQLKELAQSQNRTIKGTIICALELYFESLGLEKWGK